MRDGEKGEISTNYLELQQQLFLEILLTGTKSPYAIMFLERRCCRYADKGCA
jgi:hypothetical protein